MNETEVERLTRRLAERQADLDDARGQLSRERAEFAKYKAKVRELAIKCADEESWCAEGLNAALRELGLDERLYRYKIRLYVTGTQGVEVEVTAQDEDHARDKAEELSQEDYEHLLKKDEWDVQIDDTYVVEEVA